MQWHNDKHLKSFVFQKNVKILLSLKTEERGVKTLSRPNCTSMHKNC